MPLSAGTKLGPYVILAPIGAGGMGEVYRARDPRIGRDVAIKVLPPSFAQDADRLRRFEQEVRASGALNHPNILTIFDVGQGDGSPYIVSELLEGSTLLDRMRAGPIPTAKAIEYALEVSRGLAAAHGKGIVHRDLKPGNIFVTKDGRVKILDFGLAKLAHPAEGVGDQTQVSTETGITEAGAIVGTLSYMSPEQASGRPTDFRSDQFSLGSVAYEMATGKRPFQRNTAAETLTAIIREEPEPVAALSQQTPTLFRWFIERCLAKDAEGRFDSTRDLARDLEGIYKHMSEMGAARGILPALAPAKTSALKIFFVAAGLTLAAAAGAALVWWQLSGETRVPQTSAIRYLTYSNHDHAPAASPDGRLIAFSSDRDGQRRIWLKEVLTGSEVPLTTGGPDDLPRFSKDGSTILFTRANSLYRMSIVGGEARKLIEDAVAGDWSPDAREIAFVRWKFKDGLTSTAIGMVSVSGEGGREVARVPNYTLNFPRWSPDGHYIGAVDLTAPLNAAFSYLGATERAVLIGRTGIPSSIFLVSADGKEIRAVATPPGGTAISSLAWLSPDMVVYSQAESANGGTGRIVRHNLRSGDWQTLLTSPLSNAVLDIAGPGRIVFDIDPTSSPESLREFSLKEKTKSRWLTRGNSRDRQPVYSPNGEWVLFSSNRSGNLDLWEVSTITGALRRITDDPADDWDPAFTPDGRNILWSSRRGGHLEIWMAEADGSNARQVTHDGLDAENPTMTRDGRWIIYASANPDKKGIWKIHPDGSAATRLVTGDDVIPEVSPDGRYAVYIGAANSPLQVVRIDDGAVVAFSIRNAFRPRWMLDGRTIAFVGPDEKGEPGVFAQDFVPGQDTTRTRRALAGFDPEAPTESFGISPDGSRITLGSQESRYSLMLAERVPGIAPLAWRVR